MTTCTHPGTWPDPGKAAADALLLGWYARPGPMRLSHSRPRSCLGCGAGPVWWGERDPETGRWSAGGAFDCLAGGGVGIDEWCRECWATVWSHRIPWERWYRIVESLDAPPTGQLGLGLFAGAAL